PCALAGWKQLVEHHYFSLLVYLLSAVSLVSISVMDVGCSGTAVQPIQLLVWFLGLLGDSVLIRVRLGLQRLEIRDSLDLHS
ncbi:hypothetical protein CMEL01_04749, partial [Colletotrichum melonis]